MRKETALKQAQPGFMKRFGFYIALAVLAVIVLLPTPEGLSAQDDWGYGVFCNCLGNNGYLVPCKRRRDNGFNCPSGWVCA